MKLNRLMVGGILLLMLGISKLDARKINFKVNKETTIQEFITMFSKVKKKNILVDGEIKGKINFISPLGYIEEDELLTLLNAILATKKMTIVDKGNYYQIMKINDASGHGLPIRHGNVVGQTMETVIFKLSSINSSIMRQKVKALLHKNAKVQSFKKNNILAITAYPDTLKSVKKLIDTLERGEQKETKIIVLKHAIVKDIFQNIQSISKELFPNDIPNERVAVMKDDSANSVILIGNRRNIRKLSHFIEKLDVEGEERDVQRMYVIPLKNSNVEEMEKILSKILPQMTGNLGMGGSIHSISKASSSKIPTRRNIITRSPVKRNNKVQKAVIASDIERNALIVLANSAQIENIRETVKLLDIEKAQVYIKAKIVEVNTNLAENIGVKYGFSGGAITSNGIFSLLASSGAAPLAISSELMSFMNQGTKTIYNDAGNPIGTETENKFAFDSGIKEVFSTGIQLDLLKQNGAAQILSEPSVLCTNNKPSSIYVGQTQSIITQSQQSTQGGSNILNNYTREDIGITLNVKPRLSSNNKVSLEVETTIEDVLPGSGASADRPTTTKRSVKTNAIVNHGETIILGGLIKTSTGKSSTRIPILGDIPILGRLFTSQGEAKNKINVVIYLTPYIVKKSSDLATLRRNLDELDSIQQKFNRIVLDRLEKKRLGLEEDRGHVTFASSSRPLLRVTSSRRDSTYSNNPPQSSIVEEEETDTQFIVPSIEQEMIESEDDSSNVQSESILESINYQDRGEVDLNQIDTGIEYDEGTVFAK